MNETKSPMFRKEAVETHIRSQEKSVLLHFISPRRFFFLWVVFGLLSAIGLGLCFVHVPIYASGKALMVDCNERDGNQNQKSCVLALFPADLHSRLLVGKSLMMKRKNDRQWLYQPIMKVESKILNPFEVQNRYAAIAGDMTIPTQPVAVAFCRLDSRQDLTGSDLHAGGALEVRIDAGTRRLASFLPLLGRFFKNRPDRPSRKGI